MIDSGLSLLLGYLAFLLVGAAVIAAAIWAIRHVARAAAREEIRRHAESDD